MNIQDPISDMLVQIKNAQKANKKRIKLQSCKIKLKIAKILKKEGYIKEYKICNNKKKIELNIKLKYFNNKPVIEYIKRVSKPSLRIYKKKYELPKVMSGLGIAIISTSKGIMTDHEARKINLGGEILCYVA